MHHRIYVGPFDAVDVLGVTVARGEQIEVTADEAASLDAQPDNWAKPTTTRGKQAAADPAEPPKTPTLQPPPVGEDAEPPQAPQDDVEQPPAADIPQTPTPTPGEGDDDAQEAGQ